MNRTTFKPTFISVATLLMALLCTGPIFAGTIRWTNDDLTTPPGATQEWNYNDGENWVGSTAPADGDWVRLNRWTGSEYVGVVALLNTETAIADDFRTGNGSKLYIGSSGNLRTDGDVDGRVYIGSEGGTGNYVSIADGGQISWEVPDPATGDGVLSHGNVSLSNNATLDTAGTVKAPLNIGIASGSTMNITGGIIEAHRSWESIGVSGDLNQSGGAIQNTPELKLETGTYTISGGSITTTDGTQGLYFRDATADDGGTIHVDGSGATNISFNGMRYQGADDVNNSEWRFTLDNGADHITPVTLTANGTSGASLRNSSTLTVDLNGGVLLSGSDTFTLIERPSGSYSDTWGTGPGALWTDYNVASNNISVSLDTDAKLDTLDASTGGNSVSFAGTSTGYIDLTGLTGDETSLKLNLLWDADSQADVTDFTALLDDAGISNWLIDTDQIGIELNPSVSGTSYFAWDLLGIGSDGALKGITVIPEPATGFLVLLGGSLALMRRRRKGE